MVTDRQLLVRFFIASSCEAAINLQSTQAHRIEGSGGRGGEELFIREGRGQEDGVALDVEVGCEEQVLNQRFKSFPVSRYEH